MTLDDVNVEMSRRSGDMSADDWRDFWSMPAPAQRACSNLYRHAIWTAVGPSGWDEALAFLGVAVTIVTDVVGLKTGYDALRALV